MSDTTEAERYAAEGPPQCSSCGAKVIWIVNENGKPIPLDARKHPIYVEDSDGRHVPIWKRIGGARITHFATCPNASQHSKGGR